MQDPKINLNFTKEYLQDLPQPAAHVFSKCASFFSGFYMPHFSERLFTANTKPAVDIAFKKNRIQIVGPHLSHEQVCHILFTTETHGFHYMALRNQDLRDELGKAGSPSQTCSERHNLKPRINNLEFTLIKPC